MVRAAPLTLFRNALLFNGVDAELREGIDVLVENGRIREISDRPLKSAAALELDLAGRCLMPGLIDAHFHAYGISMDVQKFNHMPMSLLAHHGAKNLRESLQRGFTTVRDAAGADHSLAIAVETGLIEGSRVLPAGRALSQSGGHGDLRPADDPGLCACGRNGVLSIVVDGADQVRAAAREELRRGAQHVKIMMSGGVLSPTDPIWMPQFTDEEIRAAVQEAATRRTYVMAHAHTADAARRCVELGVRSIEHGTMIDRSTARLVAAAGTFVVPTLIIVEQALQWGEASGIRKSSLDKLNEIRGMGLLAYDACRTEGVKLGFGTDLLGELHVHQNGEFVLRREVASSIEILRSATSINAALIGREGELGVVKEGAIADLLAVNGNPLDDVTILAHPGENIAVIMKDGRLYRNDMTRSEICTQ